MTSYAIKTPPQHGTWADFLAVWRAADAMPVFESAWTMDHFYPLTEPLDGTHLESWSMVAALAQATERIRVGAMVNGMHYRHPAVTANMAVTVDHISGGRFNLGMGAGWFEPESNAYGMPLGSLTERFDRFDEGMAIITSMLEHETTTFHGDHYTVTEARCEPKALQRPRPPIVIGGKGPKRTLRAVARWADMWDVTRPESPAWWKELDEVLLGHCADVGRDPSEIRRSMHIMWGPEVSVDEMMRTLDEYEAAGVNVFVFSMRPPYEASRLDPLARALEKR